MLSPGPGMSQALTLVAKTGSAKSQQRHVRNRWVNFRISDVYVPEPAQILMELHGKDLLQGRVIDLSDSGNQSEAFAVVEVDGLTRPVVVPVKHIKGIICE